MCNKEKREQILEDVKKIICSDRNVQYGEPEDSFEIISSLWNIYLNSKCLCGKETKEVFVLPEDVAALMCLFKIARISTGASSKDSWLDLCGYSAIGCSLFEKEY